MRPRPIRAAGASRASSLRDVVVVGRAGAGALSVALLAVGMAEPETRAVLDGLLKGNIVVGVHASSDRVALAMQLLELAGGEALQAA